MNIKFLFIALSLFSMFFVYSDKVSAQSNTPLVCCQFSATNITYGTEYNYCSMVETCDYNSLEKIKANNTKIIEPSINQQLGSCYDDYNTEKGKGSLGTTCKTLSSNNNNAGCNEDSSLSDCIASKMPNKTGSSGSNKSTTGLVDGLSTVVNTLLGLLGLTFTAVIIYAGIQWIHYGGESEGKKKASKRIKNAVIGLAITLSAYSITSLIINNLK